MVAAICFLLLAFFIFAKPLPEANDGDIIAVYTMPKMGIVISRKLRQFSTRHSLVLLIMKKSPIVLFCLLFFSSLAAQSQLVVTVLPPKITGQKAIVELAMTNGLPEAVASARALCFLMDDQGKMVGASTRWVIGGTKNRSALEPQKGTTFNFVISSSQPFAATNLTVKVSFSRVVLDGEKLADPKTAVQINQLP